MKPTFSVEFKMQDITYKGVHIGNLTITPAVSVEIAENEIETLVQTIAKQGDAWRQAFEDATRVFQTANAAAEQATTTKGRPQSSTTTPKKKGKKKKVTSFKPAADPEPTPTTEATFDPVEE